MADALATQPKGGLGEELRVVSRFGGQIALSQLVQHLIVLTDIVMMAWLGGQSLGAGLLVSSVYVAIYVTSFGMLQGMMPMAARAAATGDAAALSVAVRLGQRIAVLASLILGAVILGFAALLEPLGFDAAFAGLAFGYAVCILPGYVLSVVLIALRNVLIALGQTQLFGAIAIAAALLNAGLNAVFGFGALGGPELGLAGIGLATTIADIAPFALFGLLVRRALRGRTVPVTQAVAAQGGSILRVAVPTAAIFFIETSMFAGVLFIVGRSDIAFLTVLGLIFQYETLAMMVPIGLSQAAVQRASVAAASGAEAAARLWIVTRASLLLVALYLLALALVQFGLHVNVPRLLILGTLDAALLAELDQTQFYAFAIILLHAFVIVIAGILRGLEDVQSSLWIVAACYWGAGLGLTVALVELGGFDARVSLQIVTAAMLLSLLSILLKLNSSLRHLRSGSWRAPNG